MPKKRASAATARPDTFMNVIGLHDAHVAGLRDLAGERASCANVTPSFAASASTNQKPALWRVRA